ncbi:MAG: ATP-binding cassette domain-containing protein [Bacteroidota bacterium]|jgi:ABC-2 type transport system ATP-binding protein
MLIEINNINKSYANHQALKNVSINIPKQSIFGLLGPNGAGKTSLIRILTQITQADSGSIKFNGENLQEKHIYEMGYLPEERGLYKKMQIGEQLLYFAELKGLKSSEAKKTVKYWVDKFEIKDWLNKKVEELSKGMQQKVQFIATVLHQPKLIILDEPFSGFDPKNAQLLVDEILNLRANGSTIIFSTHRMDTVEKLCDDIAMINKSEVVLSGNKNDIKKQFSNDEFVLNFNGSLQESSHYKIVNSTENEATINILSNKKEVIALLNNQIELISFMPKIASMEDVFIKMLNEKKPNC